MYGAGYLILRERIIPPDFVTSFRARPWGIYPHAFVGMLGLLLGPLQFHPRIQLRADIHRRIGTAYVVVAVLIGVVGFYMAMYSFGGMITHVGFAMLGALLVATTLNAFRLALNGRYVEHREWMIRSFAIMFAAPTLRLWLPILIIASGGRFEMAYQIVAWLSWVPNVLFAEWYIRRGRSKPVYFAGAPLA